MANYFDQFDQPAASAGNFFDKFDEPVKKPGQDRSFIGASAEVGVRSLLGAGARVLETALGPLTTSEEEIAILSKGDPAKFNDLMQNNAAMALSRFASEQARRRQEIMGKADPTEKGLISGKPVKDLEYSTLDPEKAAYLSPTRVAGDVLGSLPSTLALGVAAFLTRGQSVRAEAQAEAAALARGATVEEAKIVARQAAIKEGAATMAKTGALGEGAVGYGVQFDETRQQAMDVPQATLETSPLYKELIAQGFAPEVARAKLASQAGSRAGVDAGVIDAATNLVGGRILGGIIGEGGKLATRAGKGFLTEAATETVQSAGEQLASNLALQGTVNPSQRLGEGVGEAAAAGLVVGGVTGGAFAGLLGSPQRKQPEVDLDAAKNAAEAAAAANAMAGSVDEFNAARSQFLQPQEMNPNLVNSRLSTAAAQAPIGETPEDFARQDLVRQTMGAIEARGGVASPQEAALLESVGMGTPFNRLDPALGVRQSVDETLTDATNIPVGAPAGVGFSNRGLADEVARIRLLSEQNTASLTDQQLRSQSQRDAADQKLQEQIAQTQQPLTPPRAADVIQALQVPPMQRTAEQRIALQQAESRYDPADFALLSKAGTAPMTLDAIERMRVKQLREGPVTEAAQVNTPPQEVPFTPPELPNVPLRIDAEPTGLLNDQQLGGIRADESMPMTERQAAENELTVREAEGTTGMDTARVMRDEAGQRLAAAAEQGQQERSSQPTDGKVIILTGAKLSTQREQVPGSSHTLQDGGVEHSYTVVGSGKMGPVGKMLDGIARIFGKRVVVFQSDTLKADGFVLPNDNRNVYVNAQSGVSPLAVFGHEMMHLLKRDNPEAYAALERVILRNINNESRRDFEGYYNDGAFDIEEMSADLMGNRFQESEFWQEVFNEISTEYGDRAKGIIGRMVAALTKAIDQFKTAFGAQGFETDKMVEDLNAIRAAVKDAVVAYAKDQRGSAMALEAETVRAQADVDLTVGRTEPVVTAQDDGVTEAPIDEPEIEANADRDPIAIEDDGNLLAARSSAGSVTANIRDGGVYITSADVAQESRGQGEGVRLYQALVDDALSRGLKVYSDSIVQPEAARVYDALKRRGYNVQQREGTVTTKRGSVTGKGVTEPALEITGRSKAKLSTKRSTGQYSDIANDLGLTDEQYQATALPLMTGKSGAAQFNTPRIGDLPAVVTFIDQRRAALGLDKLDIANPEDRDVLAKMMAAEAIAAIRSSNNAVEWYDETINKTIQTMGIKYPELNTDPNARNAFLLATAISSQTMNVEDNLKFAASQYNAYRQTGRFPEIGTGKSAPAMAGNFKLANRVLEQLGPEMTRRFLQTPVTRRELEEIGFSVSSELMDEPMLGSAIFGSKIGFGFYSNLNGNFEPVTMDMWFMRTIGRLTGTLPAFDPVKIGKQIATLRAAMKERGPRERGLYASQFDSALVAAARTSDEGAIAFAREVDKLHNRQFIKDRARFDSGARVKTGIVRAAATILKSADKPNDLPGNGTDRRNLRDVVAKMVNYVTEQTGTRHPPAALQALIWYPEQELYKKLGVKLRVTSQDYAGAARSLLINEGFDEQQLSAATEPGSGSARSVDRQPQRRGSGQARDGRGQTGPLEGADREAFFGQRAARIEERKAEGEVNPRFSRSRAVQDVPAQELAGRKVNLQIVVEETNETATLTVDAKAALDDVNEREDTMQRLLECLSK